MLEIYTDGGYSIPRRKGGYAVVVVENDKVINYISKELGRSTSNRAELLAFVKALEIAQTVAETEIFSDSSYVVKGYNKWMKGWKNRGWKNSKGIYIKNSDLWAKIYYLKEGFKEKNVKVSWVKCNTNKHNILADTLTKY